MRLSISLVVVAALCAQVVLAKEAVGTWDDSDSTHLEAYYEDEDFFAQKDGKVPFTQKPPAQPAPKTFFIEKNVVLKPPEVKDSWNEPQYSADEHVERIKRDPSGQESPFQKLKRSTRKASNILSPPEAMRFKEVVSSASKDKSQAKAKAVSEAMPPLPVSGIIHTGATTSFDNAMKGNVPVPCTAFANNAEGANLYAQYFQQYSQWYSEHPCPGFATPGVDPAHSSKFPTINGQNTLNPNLLAQAPGSPRDVATVAGTGHPYYSDPIHNMIPALQIPQFMSPPVNFYSDGTRYPKNMEHFDTYPKAAPAGGAAAGGA